MPMATSQRQLWKVIRDMYEKVQERESPGVADHLTIRLDGPEDAPHTITVTKKMTVAETASLQTETHTITWGGDAPVPRHVRFQVRYSDVDEPVFAATLDAGVVPPDSCAWGAIVLMMNCLQGDIKPGVIPRGMEISEGETYDWPGPLDLDDEGEEWKKGPQT